MPSADVDLAVSTPIGLPAFEPIKLGKHLVERALLLIVTKPVIK